MGAGARYRGAIRCLVEEPVHLFDFGDASLVPILQHIVELLALWVDEPRQESALEGVSVQCFG